MFLPLFLLGKGFKRKKKPRGSTVQSESPLEEGPGTLGGEVYKVWLASIANREHWETYALSHTACCFSGGGGWGGVPTVWIQKNTCAPSADPDLDQSPTRAAFQFCKQASRHHQREGEDRERGWGREYLYVLQEVSLTPTRPCQTTGPSAPQSWNL